MGNFVMDVDSMFWQTWGPITVPAAYDADPDAVHTMLADMRGMTNVSILVKNTGGANAMDWRVLASMDGGVEYDLTEKAEASVAFGAIEFHKWLATTDPIYTSIKIQLKSASGTTAVVKVCGT